MADIPPDDALGRAERDPVFRARVAAAYDGEHGVMDALWWRVHPDTVSPAGTPSPSAELRRFEAVVFGRPHDADAADTAESAAAITRLEALRTRDTAERSAIDEAVAAALRDEVAATAPHAGHATDDPTVLPNRDHGDADDDRPPPAPPPWWARRPVLVLGTCAVLLGALIGAAVTMAGAYLAAGDASLAGPGASATPTPGYDSDSDSGAESGATVDSPAALRVFDREQVPSDLPAELHTVRLRQTTFRPLGPTGTGWLYAARDVDDGVCLVLVTPSGTYTASCVPQDRFPADGILLRASIDSADPADGGFTDLEVRWFPDGAVRGERTSR